MPRNKYPEETVKIILDAALKVFLEKGYEQTTVLDIVENMGGLTRGAFYHHFKSKEEVLDALGNDMFSKNNPFDMVKDRDDLTGLEKFKWLLYNSIQEQDADYRKLSIKCMEALESPAFLKRHIDDNRDLIPPMYQTIIEQGVKDGSIKTEHPKLLAELFTILTNFWMVPVIYPTTEEEMMERVFFVKEITDKLGLPVFEDEAIALAIKKSIDTDDLCK